MSLLKNGILFCPYNLFILCHKILGTQGFKVLLGFMLLLFIIQNIIPSAGNT